MPTAETKPPVAGGPKPALSAEEKREIPPPSERAAEAVKAMGRGLGKKTGKGWKTLLDDERAMIERMCKDGAQPILVAVAVEKVREIAAVATEMKDEKFEMTREELADVLEKISSDAMPLHTAIDELRASRALDN